MVRNDIRNIEREICNCYLEGKSYRQLSNKYNCCVEIIRDTLLRNNIIPRKGIPHTPEWKRQQSELMKINNPFKGKHHSEEKKKEHSVKLKKLYASGQLIAPNKGKVFSLETRNKISKTRIINGTAKLQRNPAWLGGKSFEPYTIDFNKAFKQAIILRDNNCLICGSNERLAVHHINYNKLETTKENCILLCNNCHLKTNFNRNQWQNFCQSLLTEKYFYKYQDGKMIIQLNAEADSSDKAKMEVK